MSSIKEANKHIQMLYQRLYDSERQKDLVIENKDKEIEELREKIKALEKINQTQEDRIKHLQYSTSLFSTKLEELNNICQKELNENDGL